MPALVVQFWSCSSGRAVLAIRCQPMRAARANCNACNRLLNQAKNLDWGTRLRSRVRTQLIHQVTAAAKRIDER